MAHVIDREDRVQHLALLAVLVILTFISDNETEQITGTTHGVWHPTQDQKQA